LYKGKSILAVIPARGGSKGLPGKNIKELCGKPLVAWSVEQAKTSKYLDKIIVSTDDEKIAEKAKQYGAEVPFLRPAKLAQDGTPTIDVLIHLIDYLKDKGLNYDILVLLEPTSPLRKKGDIDSAIEILVENYEVTDSVISLGEVHLENPHVMKVVENNYLKKLIQDSSNILRRQDYPDVYFPYGVFYGAKIESLLKHKTFYTDRAMPHFIERWQNYELDDVFDFLCIEAVMKEKMEKIL